MTNKEVIDLKTGLDNNIQGLKSLRGMKFAYALNKNFKILSTELETFQEMFKPDEKYQEFESARTELCQEFCEKDEDGNMLFENNNSAYKINTSSQEWIDAYNALTDKFKKTLKVRDKQINDYTAFLMAESEIELYKIDIDEVPENISVEEYELIQFFVKD